MTNRNIARRFGGLTIACVVSVCLAAGCSTQSVGEGTGANLESSAVPETTSGRDGAEQCADSALPANLDSREYANTVTGWYPESPTALTPEVFFSNNEALGINQLVSDTPPGGQQRFSEAACSDLRQILQGQPGFQGETVPLGLAINMAYTWCSTRSQLSAANQPWPEFSGTPTGNANNAAFEFICPQVP